MRNLTFASDRYRAFQGLEARLSKLYDINFLHAMPLTDGVFPPALLWGRMDFRDFNTTTTHTEKLPSWAAFCYCGAQQLAKRLTQVHKT